MTHKIILKTMLSEEDTLKCSILLLLRNNILQTIFYECNLFFKKKSEWFWYPYEHTTSIQRLETFIRDLHYYFLSETMYAILLL